MSGFANTTVFGATEGGETRLLNPPTDLGIDEYRKFRVALDKARHQIRGDYERSKMEEANLRGELLDKCDKLYHHIKDEQQALEDKKKVAEHDRGLVSQLDDAFGTQTAVFLEDLANKEQREAERVRHKQFGQLLMKEIEDLEKNFRMAQSAVEKQNNNLAQLLNEQGTAIATVEQAEALNTKLLRRKSRKDAHDAILDALRGCHQAEPGDISVIIDQSDSLENQGIRAQNDRHLDPATATEIKSVADELRRLEALEEHIDQLVDRLKVKLDAINLLEESQVEMVDFQVRKHSKLLQRVTDIESKVMDNNEQVSLIHDKMKAEFFHRLENVQGGRSAKQWLFFGLLVILICSIGTAGFILYKFVTT